MSRKPLSDKFQICDSLQIDFLYKRIVLCSVKLRQVEKKGKNFRDVFKKLRKESGSKTRQVVGLFLSNV